MPLLNRAALSLPPFPCRALLDGAQNVRACADCIGDTYVQVLRRFTRLPLFVFNVQTAHDFPLQRKIKREIFVDHLLVRVHLIIEMSRPALSCVGFGIEGLRGQGSGIEDFGFGSWG